MKMGSMGLVGLGALLLGAAPAMAQATPGEVSAYASHKPSGSLGTFAWYANGQYTAGPAYLTGNAFLPGLAVNVWFNPFFSIGAWGMTGAFGGALGGVVGPFTNGDLEAKLKIAQTSGAYGIGLTADLGGELRSIGVGTGTSPKLGGIVDFNLPSHMAMQARLDWAPWLYVNNVQSNVLDYKLGIGWQLFHGLGVDLGLRGQTAFAPGNLLSLNGPYMGFGYLF
jgi:hypothetical protein